MALGYGLSPYGLGPYGLGGAGTLYIMGVEVISERTVRVSLSTPAAAVNAAIPGDALNPQTWTLHRQDTGESLIVLAVDDVNGDGQTFELYTLRKFANALITHRVSSDTLMTPSGLVISAPNDFDFPGAIKAVVATAPSELVDIANPPFGGGGNVIAGTLQITDAADYKLESGTAFLRKLIIRRLTTSPGAFFHLEGYGIGIKQNEPLPISDLSKLKAKIRLQVLEEPEITSASIGLTLTPSGILTIRVDAILSATNEQVSVTLDVPIA